MFDKLLVAIDFSVNSRHVFDEALALAQKTGSSLMLLHVLSNEEEGSPNMPIIGSEYYLTIADEIARIHQKQWQEYENRGLEILQDYTKEATAAGVTSEFTQNLGSPGRTICELANSWGADLIVIGRRGHSGISELIMGSVSNYVMHHAPCSVLTIQGKVSTHPATAQDQPAEMPLQAQ
jgi:nucleotide-binding universal stress UspA family protein